MNSAHSEHHVRAQGAQRRFVLPPDARQIILVRHGSSTGATTHVVELGELTISNPPLTADGEYQAEAVAHALGSEVITAITVTPLQRTQQTAAPLARAKGLTPRCIDDLREVHLGDWEHSFYDHAAAGHPLVSRMFIEESWDVIPNAESSTHFADRVRRGLADVCAIIGAGETAAFSAMRQRSRKSVARQRAVAPLPSWPQKMRRFCGLSSARMGNGSSAASTKWRICQHEPH